MALKYHPDVRTNPSSTAEERKAANDDFSRINSAYAFLSGKSEDRPTDANGKTSSTAGSRGRPGSRGAGTGSGYGYTPPHRRSGSDRKSYSESNWKDYMPKYDDDEQYDAGGDSFGAIFSDLFTEVASGAASGAAGAGGGGLLNDLISFLEGNFPSVGTNPTQRTEEDIILDTLLRDGSKGEIKDELDDAKLLVKQLESKELNLDSELRIITKEREELSNSNRKGSTYMEDMGLEERRREVEARKSVVLEYLENARLRQIKLRRRYEELRSMDTTGGERRSYSQERSRSRPSNDGPQSTSSSSSSSSTSRTYGDNTSTSGGASSSSSDDDSWKRESFGSSRRSRGGSRGRSRGSSGRRERERTSASSTSGRSNPSTASGTKSSNYSTSTGSSYGGYSSTSSRRSTTTTSSPSTNSGAGATRNLPPHRRLTQTYAQKQEDKRRLREIKVDEEIDRMKEELGL